MVDALTEPFRLELAQRALIEIVVLGAVCGPLGTWVVLSRQSYAAESIAHAALPGLVLATLAGVPLALGAAGGLLVAALAIALANRDEAIGSDVGVAVAVTSLFGAGALLALSPDAPARLGALLFGDPLSVSGADIALSATLAAVILGALASGHRGLTLTVFDRPAAPSLGARPGQVDAALLVLLALTTLVAVDALGNLLVVALLIAPGAAALRLTDRLTTAMPVSAVIAIGAGVAGLYASHYMEIAAGAAIALAALIAFAISLAIGARSAGPDRSRSPIAALGSQG